MAPIGTLCTVAHQHAGRRIRAVAAYAGLEVTVPVFVNYQDNYAASFTAKFPHGKIPALETADGFLLTECTAICKYMASIAPEPMRRQLLGRDAKEEALIEQWIGFADAEIGIASKLIYHLLVGMMEPYSKDFHLAMAARQTAALRIVNAHLSDRTFLVGDRVSLADISMASIIQRALSLTFSAALRQELSNVMRFYETVANQEGIREQFGETKYVEKVVEFKKGGQTAFE